MCMFIPVIFAMITIVMSPLLLGQEESLLQGIAAPEQISLIKIKGDAGLRYVGTIIERNDKEIVLLTEGKIKVLIPIETILDIRTIPSSHFHDGEYWFPNPNETRYLYAPSAFNLKKGEDIIKTPISSSIHSIMDLQTIFHLGWDLNFYLPLAQSVQGHSIRYIF